MYLVLGAPGIVATRLVEALRARGEQVAVLAPVYSGELSPQGVNLILGNGTQMDFGLSGSEYRNLINSVSRVYLVAEPSSAIENIEDSSLVRYAIELREFVRAGGARGGVVFLSSLLVFGDAVGPLSEDDFFLGQGFRDKYEESLALAEKIVRKTSPQRELAILRTGPIVGDVRSGTVLVGSPLDHLQNTLERITGTSEQGHSFSDQATRWETVERAVSALLTMAPSGEIRVAHLVDSDPLTDRALLEWIAKRKGVLTCESTGGVRAWHLWKRPSFGGSRSLRGWSANFLRIEAEKNFHSLLDRDEKSVLEAIFPEDDSAGVSEE